MNCDGIWFYLLTHKSILIILCFISKLYFTPKNHPKIIWFEQMESKNKWNEKNLRIELSEHYQITWCASGGTSSSDVCSETDW